MTLRERLLEIIHFNNDCYCIKKAPSQSVPGWNSDSPIFGELISKHTPKLIIEIGSWKGASAIHMAKVCKNLQIDTQILCIDTWLGSEEYYTTMREIHPQLNKKNGFPSIYYEFLSNIVNHKVEDFIIPFPINSTIACSILKHYKIKADIIYIDASHDYQSVMMDLHNSYELLSKNGVIFGDDFQTWIGVNQAVTDFVKSKNLILHVKEDSKYVISFKKPKGKIAKMI